MKVYHRTTRDRLRTILKEGLKLNQLNNITSDVGSYNLELAYGKIPIFVSLSSELYPVDNENHILLEIDSDFDMRYSADIGFLIEKGAYLEESGFYFDKGSEGFEKGFDEEYTYDCLGEDPEREDFIQLTKTFAIEENIPPNKIHIKSRNQVR